jgi:hypothetical protein
MVPGRPFASACLQPYLRRTQRLPGWRANTQKIPLKWDHRPEAMKSRTVPKKLLEQFAFYDAGSRSNRLWQYQKGLPPWGHASPKSSTRWDGHFADPANTAKEEQLELRLKQEFEDPVNEFIEVIGYRAFFLSPRHIRLLTGYIRMLFTRSIGRQAASAVHAKTKMDAFRSLLKDDKKLAELAAHYTMNAIKLGLPVTEMVTKEQVIAIVEKQIAEHSRPDEPQRDYIQALETMMTFPDETMLNGTWGIMTTDAEHPFVIGDAPVVTMERTEGNRLYFGIGFARPNVEVFLPVSPSACIHVLPQVARTRQPLPPSPVEVNMAQAAFATKHCFGSINSPETDAILQPQFGTIRLGDTGFNTRHIDHNQVLFDILMGQRPRAA